MIWNIVSSVSLLEVRGLIWLNGFHKDVLVFYFKLWTICSTFMNCPRYTRVFRCQMRQMKEVMLNMLTMIAGCFYFILINSCNNQPEY